MHDEFDRYDWPLQPEKSKNVNSQNAVPANVKLYHMKKCALISFVTEYPKEADLKWSLFCAACNSYRFDSVVKPFPPFFLIDDENKQIDRLREIIELCPPMPELLDQLKKNAVPQILFDILFWVLIHLNEPSYKLVPKDEHEEIIHQVPSVMQAALPDHIFNLTYGSRHQQKFALTALSHSTKLAFHGSRVDNFYSIVNNGLQVSFNKRDTFGPGIYLSSEMGISLPYSPRGFTWNNSCFGSHISIVALCEIIDHPDVRSEFDSKSNYKSNIFEICDRPSIPGKYFILDNNDFVRIRSLLIYSSEDSENSELLASPTLLGWIKRHKMFTLIAAYVVLLLAIGSSNSSLIYKYYRRYFR